MQPDLDRKDRDIRFPVSPGTIRKFREQIHALGGLWIFIGACAIVIVAIASQGGDFAKRLGDADLVMLGVVMSLGGLWLTVGILTCFKQLWAVYVGLGLCYLSLAGQILHLNVCGLIIVIVAIIQAHRVISWAKELQAAGIPLTTKPEPRKRKKPAEEE
jgi:hypothetical protein